MKHKFHVVPSAGNMEMIWVEPGKLVYPEEMRKRPIEIKEGFYLGKYEFTQAENASVKNSSNARGRTPSFFSSGREAKNRPVESISFQDVRSFLNNLNTIEDKAGRIPEGWKYVLPTEDEFWYASYAGMNSRYPWGDNEILSLYYDIHYEPEVLQVNYIKMGAGTKVDYIDPGGLRHITGYAPGVKNNKRIRKFNL